MELAAAAVAATGEADADGDAAAAAEGAAAVGAGAAAFAPAVAGASGCRGAFVAPSGLAPGFGCSMLEKKAFMAAELGLGLEGRGRTAQGAVAAGMSCACQTSERRRADGEISVFAVQCGGCCWHQTTERFSRSRSEAIGIIVRRSSPWLPFACCSLNGASSRSVCRHRCETAAWIE